MSGFTIRKLTMDDLERAKAVRAEALELHPEAFSSDSGRDGVLSLEQWHERLGSGRWFGAFIAGELVGTAAWVPGSTLKTAHAAELGGMYVREAARGSGVADALIGAVFNDARKQIDFMSLTVNAENARAVRAYERNGFAVVGRIPKALRYNGRDYDEFIMWRSLKNK